MIEQLRQTALRLLRKLPTHEMRLNKNSDTEIVIREWRTTILNVFLTIVAIASLPALGAILYSQIPAQKLDFFSYVLIVVVLALILLSIFRRFNYQIRVHGFLVVAYTTAIVDLTYTGIRGLGSLFLLLISIAVLILIGKRASIYISALSVIVLSVITVLNRQGLLVPIYVPTFWVVLTATLTIFTIVMTLLILFYRLQEQIIDNERGFKAELIQTQRLLEEQNANLEQKVKERTEELQQSNRILSALYKITDAASGSQDIHVFFTRIHQIIGELMYAGNFFIALYDESSGLLSFPYFVDEKDEPFSTQPLENFHGMTSYMIRTGNSIKHGPD